MAKHEKFWERFQKNVVWYVVYHTTVQYSLFTVVYAENASRE